MDEQLAAELDRLADRSRDPDERLARRQLANELRSSPSEDLRQRGMAMRALPANIEITFITPDERREFRPTCGWPSFTGLAERPDRVHIDLAERLHIDQEEYRQERCHIRLRIADRLLEFDSAALTVSRRSVVPGTVEIRRI